MKIALLGIGTVGGGVRQIIDQALGMTGRLQISHILIRPEHDKTDPRMTDDYADILGDPEVEVVVEAIGGLEPAHTYVRQALESGRHVVSSNKKMLAAYYPELLAIARQKNVRLLYEGSCGGGIPWLAALARLKRIDHIQSFQGILNGTTNYILSNMTEKGRDFAEMLSQAQELGYAEADPTDDIDGLDVRCKVCLSAVQAFDVYLKPESIPAYGIRHVTAQDIAWAGAHGYTIKLVGSGFRTGQGICAQVMPMLVSDRNLLAHVGANLNAVSACSDTLGVSTYIGQGAGRNPTAHAVVQDILEIAEQPQLPMNEVQTAENDLSGVQGVYYLSGRPAETLRDLQNPDIPDALVTRKMPLAELLERLSKLDSQLPFVAQLEETDKG